MVLIAEQAIHIWHKLGHAGLRKLRDKLYLIPAHCIVVTEQHCIDHSPSLEGIVAGLVEVGIRRFDHALGRRQVSAAAELTYCSACRAARKA